MSDLEATESLVELYAKQEDIRHVVRGLGGNNKLMFEIGAMEDNVTVAIRAAQGHSHGSGVSDDVLPAAEDLLTLVHGATLKAAKSIAVEGIMRGDRIHVHFYESDSEGRPVDSTPPVRLTSEVIVAVSAEKCERSGLVFHRAPNGAILTAGLDGVVPAECILCVRWVSDYAVLWSSMSRHWGSRSAPVLSANQRSAGSNQSNDRFPSAQRYLGAASSSGDPGNRSRSRSNEECDPMDAGGSR